eukprot:2549291-Rhodomonas_salina.1
MRLEQASASSARGWGESYHGHDVEEDDGRDHVFKPRMHAEAITRGAERVLWAGNITRQVRTRRARRKAEQG